MSQAVRAVEVTCPKCRRCFTRRIAGSLLDVGGQGWYYPATMADWCFDCRAGWIWD